MENSLEKKNHYNLLYTYYLELLTPKQKEVFEYYYFEDYTLKEISDSLGVSRNAIWDLLNKVEKNLDEYEEKLHLAKKDKQLKSLLNDLGNHVDSDGLKIIEKINEME